MADIVSPEVRSRMMSGIRGRDTKPELMLRKGLHAAGFRYRLHVKDLPGKPDMVFPRHRAVLFAHGCFWHGHDCHLFRWPSTRQDWWREKITRNQTVDACSEHVLAERGWRIGVVWECALKGRDRLPFADVLQKCIEWLRSDAPALQIRGLL
jgi:DNA mismatch endonuclease (patch repair protein)